MDSVISASESTKLNIESDTSTITAKPKRAWKKADSTSEWKCSVCNKYYCSKAVLENHTVKCRNKYSGAKNSRSVSDIRVRNHPAPTSEWQCSICEKPFSNKYVLMRHMTRCEEKSRGTHKKQRSVEKVSISIGTHLCVICQRSFNHKSNLVSHIKTYHSTVDVDRMCPRRQQMVLCPACPMKTKSLLALSNHVRDTHAEDETPGTLLFDTAAEFQMWKQDEEKRTVSCFVKNRGGSHNKNVERFYCHRSGKFKSSSTQKRHLKMQGSCKAGTKCPASVIAVYSLRGVMVFYNSSHNGHSMVLNHIPLSQSERQEVARMISSGMSNDDILTSIRQDLSKTEFSRLHLIQRRDLFNIARDFRLRDHQRKYDAEGVRSWVEICGQENSEMIRFIKFPGEDGRIGVDDFMIVLMNDIQVDMLQHYGPYRLNCIASTHGTNAVNFQLTTLLVVDVNGEWFPVAFCVSSRIDAVGMEVFLEHVQLAIGCSVKGAVLMTDDAPEYLDAWQTVMGPPAHHVLCSWQIEKTWKKNLGKINHSPEVKARVSKMLRDLLETDSKERFSHFLQLLIREIEDDENMAEFLEYFRQEYVSSPEVWAYAYQIDVTGQHNIHLDNAHQTLNDVFMQGRKVITRLDESLNALLRLLRIKTFDHVLKQDGYDVSQYIYEIRNRHSLSRCLMREQIASVESRGWLVHDERGDYAVSQTLTADVRRLHTSKDALCKLLCDACNICVHTFTCTCMDYELRNTVCKHIHAVVQTCGFEPIAGQSDSDGDENDAGDLAVAVIKPTKTIVPKVKCEPTNDCDDDLREIDELITSIRGSLDGSRDSSLIAIVKEALKSIAAMTTDDIPKSGRG